MLSPPITYTSLYLSSISFKILNLFFVKSVKVYAIALRNAEVVQPYDYEEMTKYMEFLDNFILMNKSIER